MGEHRIGEGGSGMNLLWLQINFARFQAEEFTLNLGWPLCPCQPAQWKLQQHTRFCNGCVG